MTEQQDPPSDEPQEDEVPEEAQNQSSEMEDAGYDEPDADDSPELRLQALTVEYARERAALAEQISQLQQENDRLTRRVQVLEQPNPLRQNELTAPPESDEHYTEHGLGLDFSVPEDRR